MYAISSKLPALLLAFWCLAPSPPAHASKTMGLFLNDPDAYDGYTLFSPIRHPDTFLIDNDGLLVHRWVGDFVTGNTSYLLENGHLIRAADPGGNTTFVAGGDAGLVQEYDWDGTKLWEFLYSDSTVRHHHDIEPLPNGNVLLIAWEYKSSAEATQAGRDPLSMETGELWPEHLIEVEKVGASGGNIVWEWHLWDHLIQDFDATKDNFGVVADHPELVDINFRRDDDADWIHMNSIDYNPDLDQIVISAPRLNEFWIIDHSTTTAEAASHSGGVRGMGGDILYRWGNPQAYDRGTEMDRKLFNQHDVDWIPSGEGLLGEGNILVHNNGGERPEGEYSSVDEIETTVDGSGNYPALAAGVAHGPTSAVYSYVASPPSSFFSGGLSGAQRLATGGLLVCEGRDGRIFEVDANGGPVWNYIIPVGPGGPLVDGTPPLQNWCFRSHRYAVDYPGFDGRDLTPGDPIEIDPIPLPALSTGATLALLGSMIAIAGLAHRKRLAA